MKAVSVWVESALFYLGDKSNWWSADVRVPSHCHVNGKMSQKGENTSSGSDCQPHREFLSLGYPGLPSMLHH